MNCVTIPTIPIRKRKQGPPPLPKNVLTRSSERTVQPKGQTSQGKEPVSSQHQRMALPSLGSLQLPP